MSDVRKVSASAGAEWLLGGFGLLRKSPFGFGLLGAIFGLLSAGIGLLSLASPTLILPLQLVMMLLGPLLIAGMIWAAREVDLGRSAQPGQLLRGVQDGKSGRLLATLLPQIAAGLVAVLLLFVLVGPQQLQHLVGVMEQAQSGAADPSSFSGFPVGRLFLWLLLVLVIGVLAGFFTFTAIADMMFTSSGAIEAMKRSFRACLRNLGAMIVFFVLLIITAVALGIAVQIVAFVVRLALGATAGMFVAQILLMAVLMAVVTGAMYMAWKQMVAGSEEAPVAGNVSGGIEV